jgi:DNA polymerase I-like protein with 3'-5' exonuclease and polymerase domains
MRAIDMDLSCRGTAALNLDTRTPQEPIVAGHSIDEPLAADKGVCFILREMEKGFRVDVHTLRNIKRSYESTLFNLEKEIQTKSGKTVRIDSNRELGDTLFREFSLPSLRDTLTGKPCVSVDVLERLCDFYADTHPFLK